MAALGSLKSRKKVQKEEEKTHAGRFAHDNPKRKERNEEKKKYIINK